jgi:signal transduction histidine kinase
VILATDRLAFIAPRERRTRSNAIVWAGVALVLHAVGVFGLADAFPDHRVIPVASSRLLKLAILYIPAHVAWRSYARAEQNQRAVRLLALGFSALTLRQALSVLLGLRVGMPDLPFAAVVIFITLEVIAIIVFGVMSLLANTAEELAVVQRQSEALVRAETRIASGERMESLGRLAAGVAHDFNNVLQVVRLASGSLRPTLVGHRDVVVLDEIGDATTHGAALVSQLLTFARQQPGDTRRIDAFDRMRTLAPMLQRIAGKAIQTNVNVAAGFAVVLMDPAQLEQVAMNLVANARDAVGAHGRIDVRVDVVSLDVDACRCAGVEPGEYVRLSVQDDGHGIPEDVRGRIFEPFFTTKAAGTGSGLGLSLVHGIARRATGNVTVESTPGVGTRFDVYLPVADLTKDGRVATAQAAPSSPPLRQVAVND